MNKLILFLIFFSIINSSDVKIKKALCILPISDLVGYSLKQFGANVKEQYSKIAISGYKGEMNCIREHQVLFNEIVEIIEDNGEEFKIKIPNGFYQNYGSTFWSLKENFIDIEFLDLKKIPTPIDYNSKNLDSSFEQVITLISPYFDKTTNKKYSAGTRFKYKNKTENSFTIYIYNPESKTFLESDISKDICFESLKLSNEEKINNFVKILKLWTNSNTEFIPFAWGGCSYIEKTLNNYNLVDDYNVKNESIQYWKDTQLPKAPYPGFDASGLIFRAAQICEIPYFYKNTITASNFLKPLSLEDKLQEGDLIWFPGYITAISNLKDNLVIGARGYQHGYGKIIEQKLNDLFVEIETFEQLLDAYFNKKKINNIDNKGLLKPVNEFKILRISSCWEIKYL